MKWYALVKFNFWAEGSVPDDLNWEHHHLHQHLRKRYVWEAFGVPRSATRPVHWEADMRERYYQRRKTSAQFKEALGGDSIKKVKLKVTSSDPGYKVHFWVRKSRVPDGASIEAASA